MVGLHAIASRLPRSILFRKNEAGALIGRNGENINKLCELAGCELKVQKENEAAPDGPSTTCFARAVASLYRSSACVPTLITQSKLTNLSN